MDNETRLIGTLLTEKPSPNAFIIASCTVLLMALVTLFYWNNTFGFSQYLAAGSGPIISNRQWWRIFTAIFIHADTAHLLSNMLLLWFFSFFVFGYFGTIVYPVLAYLGAGVVNFLVILTYPPDAELLGASGLVYLLGGFWLTLYFLLQRQHRWLNRLLRVAGIGLMIFVPSTFSPSISYRTHVLGFATGIIMGLIYFFSNKCRLRSREVYQIIEPTDQSDLLHSSF